MTPLLVPDWVTKKVYNNKGLCHDELQSETLNCIKHGHNLQDLSRQISNVCWKNKNAYHIEGYQIEDAWSGQLHKAQENCNNWKSSSPVNQAMNLAFDGSWTKELKQLFNLLDVNNHFSLIFKLHQVVPSVRGKTWGNLVHLCARTLTTTTDPLSLCYYCYDWPA